mgnify:CR=1 FL=1
MNDEIWEAYKEGQAAALASAVLAFSSVDPTIPTTTGDVAETLRAMLHHVLTAPKPGVNPENN